MSTLEIRNVGFDLSDPEVNKHIHAHFRDVRKGGPVVRNTVMERWMVGGFEDVRRTINDEQHFLMDSVFFDTIFGARVFNGENNPRHNEMRSSWNRYFRRGDIERQREAFEEVAHAGIDRLAKRLHAGETVEFVHEVALEVMTASITRMLGIPAEEVPDWQGWG